jgi:hypothetical protein
MGSVIVILSGLIITYCLVPQEWITNHLNHAINPWAKPLDDDEDA